MYTAATTKQTDPTAHHVEGVWYIIVLSAADSWVYHWP